ncbi:hypothetical protein MFRU_013g01040 [Monilinia fructicola]|nr:hypothetical protein MFRU_013g01040 [Monilinia fructicola]
MSTTACLCEANSITCHHRSSILKTADLTSCKWIDGKGVSPLKLKVPPPRPEPTAHLAVLRDPRHPEWKARPASYQSPALCNTSSIYLKRVVEPEARKKLIKQEEVPQNAAFSLSIAQRRELQHQREEEEIFMQRWTARINELARAGVHESSHSTTSNLSSSPALNPSVNNNVAHGSGARGNVIASSQNTTVIIVSSHPISTSTS